MSITTNNHIREYTDVSDVPEAEKNEWNDECSLWIKYKGMYIALAELTYLPDSEWSGVYGLTNTASIVFKEVDDDHYIVGLAT